MSTCPLIILVLLLFNPCRGTRRVLVHSAPGSGGSLLTFLLGQSTDTLCFPNLRSPPPRVTDLSDVPPELNIILKVGVGDSNTSLARAIESFEPHVKILVVRHPVFTAGPAATQQVNEILPRETILRRLEWVWGSSLIRWDAVILFEEVLFNPSVTRQKLKNAGFSDSALDSMDSLLRSKEKIERSNFKNSRWSRQLRPSKSSREASSIIPGWDFGGVSRAPARQLEAMRTEFWSNHPTERLQHLAQKLCPSVLKYYSDFYPDLKFGAERDEKWLTALRRLHSIVDDHSSSFSSVPDTGGRATIMRERWIVLGQATHAWVQSGVALNWVAALHRVGCFSHLVLSLDHACHESLTAIGVPSFFHETHSTDAASSSSGNLGTYKWKVIFAILRRGVTVVSCDLDSVVLRNFRSVVEQSQSHIISGKGISKGTIIRSQFIVLRSSVEVLNMFPLLLNLLSRVKDDEVALNRMFNGVIRWAKPPLGTVASDEFIEGRSFRSFSIIANGPLSSSTGSTLDPLIRITLVPNRLFRLHECDRGHPVESALFMHCTSRTMNKTRRDLVIDRQGKLVERKQPSSEAEQGGYRDTADAIQARLVEVGCWILSPKWKQQFDLIQVDIP